MVEIIKSSLLEQHGFAAHGFVARTGGRSAGEYSSLNSAHDVGDDPNCVAANMRIIHRAADLDHPLLRAIQVHGNKTICADEHDADESWERPGEVEADALIAPSDSRVVVAVQTADCAPILVADPNSGMVAAIHAGWRGASRGIVRQALREMVRRGGDPSALIACIGPRIGLECYEVGEEVARHFPESVDQVPRKPGAFLLDLGRALEVSLIAAGLPGSRIELLPVCSHSDETRWFSHRRSGGACGRNLAFIAPIRS